MPVPVVNDPLTTLHVPQRRSEPCETFVSAQKSLSWSRARMIDVSAVPHRSRDSFSHGPLHPSDLSARYAQRVRHSSEWKQGLCEPFISPSSPVPAGPQVRLPRLAMPRRTRLRVPRQSHQLHRGRARKGSFTPSSTFGSKAYKS